MQKGNIGVTTENIFPIIKKFLYSDHEIFLRELVSNAVDATQKLKTLASKGEFKGEMGDLTIKVSLGKDTITISDRGIGLTAEEIDKYINQIAFSGANDFLWSGFLFCLHGSQKSGNHHKIPPRRSTSCEMDLRRKS